MKLFKAAGSALLGLAMILAPNIASAATTPEPGPTQSVTIEPVDIWGTSLPRRGTSMGREATNLAVAKDAVVEARVTNNVQGVQIAAISLARDTDEFQEIPTNGEWTPITAKADSGIFFNRAAASAWTTKPQVEYRVKSGTSYDMPKYRHGEDYSAFMAAWDKSDAPFATVIDDQVLFHIPKGDKEKLKDFTSFSQYKTMDEVIESYRSILDTYDKYLGLEKNATNPLHQQRKHTYFVRADTTGVGQGYYVPSHVGWNGSSILGYITSPNEWITLHEIGHGYDGFMTHPVGNNDIPLGEVWNNVYSHSYQLEVSNKPTWLFDLGATEESKQAQLDARRFQAGVFDMNDIGYRERLEFMVRMLYIGGIDTLASLNRGVREDIANGMDPWGTKRSDMVSKHWGTANGVSTYAWMKSYNVDLSPEEERIVQDVNPLTMVMPLSDYFRSVDGIVDQEGLDAAKAKLNLPSAGRLVTTEKVRELGLAGSGIVTAEISDQALVEGKKAELYDGKTKVAEAEISNGKASFTDVPRGTYRVVMPASQADTFAPTTWIRVGAVAGEATATYVP